MIYPHMMVAHWEFGDDEWLVANVPLNPDDRTISWDDWPKPRMWHCVYAKRYGTDPTHWQPLPAPPKPTDAGTK